jgi:hypothetical protein
MVKGFMIKMVVKYQRWIDKNVPDRCIGLCRRKSEEMVAKFPELRIVGTSCQGMFEHCWCVTKKGNVVDPTAHQFSHPLDYTRYLELPDFPTGKCPECGELMYPDTPGTRAFFNITTDEDAKEEGIGSHKSCYERFMREMEMED